MANTSAIERLKKILALEQKQGYRNKAVIGGLERLSERWVDDAQQEASTNYQRSLVLKIVRSLQAYGSLDNPPARQEAVAAILALTDLWSAEPPEGFVAEVEPEATVQPEARTEKQRTSRSRPSIAGGPAADDTLAACAYQASQPALAATGVRRYAGHTHRHSQPKRVDQPAARRRAASQHPLGQDGGPYCG